MKIYCITENKDFEVGMKLAGCDGITIQDNENITNKIDEIINNKDIGVLVISKDVYNKCKDKVDNIRFNCKLPLIAIV